MPTTGALSNTTNRVLAVPLPGTPGVVAPAPVGPVGVVRSVVPKRTEERLAELEREAYEAGFAAGERAGHEAGESAVRRVQAALTRVQQALDSLQTELVDEARADVLHLSLAISRQVLDYEVAEGHPVVVAGIEAAKAHFTPDTPLTLRIHPSDLEVLEQHQPALLDELKTRSHLVPSPELAAGGVLASGGGNAVDARLVTRFEQVVDSLLEANP